MDKCIIKTADRLSGNCIIRLNAATYKKVVELSVKTGRSISSLASELLEFAIDRVEIDYQYKDLDDGQMSMTGDVRQAE